MTGQALRYPGFCFTRITDFCCYMWIPQVLDTLGAADYGGAEDTLQFADYEPGQWDHLLPDSGSFYENFSMNNTIDTVNFEERLVNYEEQIATYLTLFLSPIILLFGSIGNVLSMLTMIQMTTRILSSCYYLAVLNVLDLTLLYICIGNEWLKVLCGLDVSNWLLHCSETACKVYTFAFNCVFHMSRWLMVCVAVEGFIGLKMPKRAKELCNHDRSKGIMWLMTVLIIWVNIHYFWSFELLIAKQGSLLGRKVCTFPTQLAHQSRIHQHSEEFQRIIWPVIELLIGELIPAITIFLCVMSMTMRLCKGDITNKRQSHRPQPVQRDIYKKLSDSPYKMIAALCWMYLIFNVPKTIFTMFKYLFERHFINFPNTMSVEIKLIPAQSIFTLLDGCYYSFQFFVCLWSTACFRNSVKQLLRCCHGSTSSKPPMAFREELMSGHAHTVDDESYDVDDDDNEIPDTTTEEPCTSVTCTTL